MATDCKFNTEVGEKTKFSNEKHARNILSALNESRKSVNLCDGVVILAKQRIMIQKAVLSSASHYFRLIFSYDGVDGKPQSEVDMTSLNITLDTFEQILDYIYTSEIHLSEDNIQDILQASDILLLADLKETCCEYLEGCITLQNCLGISEFAAQFTCPWIHLKASKFVDENFTELTYTEEFMKLPEASLKKLLCRDMLTVFSEDDILDGVIRWYQYDTSHRESVIQTIIIDCVRVPQLSESCITKLLSSDIGGKVKDVVKNLVEESLSLKKEPIMRGMTEMIMIAGGEGQKDRLDCDDEDLYMDDNLEVKSLARCVSPRFPQSRPSAHSSWIDLAPMTTRRSGHGLVHCGGYVFAIGGRDENQQLLNTGEKYNPLTNCWTPIASMGQMRMQLSVVAIDDNLYAIGGLGSYDNMEPLTSVEVYNIFTNTWHSLPDMNLKRISFSCVTLDKKIYVIGGGYMGKPYEAVECFDTRTETWNSASPLREKRYNGRAVTVGDEIYMFGGMRRFECPSASYGSNNIKFCETEVYSFTKDIWLPIPRRIGMEVLCTRLETSQLYCAVTNGEDIYMLGYLDMGDGYVNCIRSFDRRMNSWQCVVQNAPRCQVCFPACVIQIPTQMLHRLTTGVKCVLR